MSGAIGAIAGIAGGVMGESGGISEEQFAQAAAEAGTSILMNTMWPLLQEAASDAQSDDE